MSFTVIFFKLYRRKKVGKNIFLELKPKFNKILQVKSTASEEFKQHSEFKNKIV